MKEREDLVAGDMSYPLPRGYFFRSLYSISYLEYQPFFVHSESKARRIELLGLRDTCLAAIETSSLP